MRTASDIWEEALLYIKNNISSAGFSACFTHSTGSKIKGNTFHINTSNILFKELLENYDKEIKEALFKVTGEPLSFKIDINGDDDDIGEEDEEILAKTNTYQDENGILNKKFTFDNFVVGPNNEFAYSAAYAISQKPGRDAYNPLLLYGGSGLGKTHLLHAVGNEIKNNDPSKVVTYVTAEQFVNLFIDSIKRKTNDDFKKKFRTTDVLLIDDIQFFAGKEGSQEEFFHTFNELVNNNKQIMLTSDRPPKDIYPLEERMRTRLSSRIMADLQPPNFETRLAILYKKAKSDNLSGEITDEIFTLIANQVKTNIRELEGALRTILAYSDISQQNLDLDMANKILSDYFTQTQKRKIDANYIIKAVEKHFNLTDNVIIGPKRDSASAYPRQIAMYICRELTQLSLPEIGKEFGGRDHSTVLHNIKKIHKIMEQDLNTMNTVNDLIKDIKND